MRREGAGSGDPFLALSPLKQSEKPGASKWDNLVFF